MRHKALEVPQPRLSRAGRSVEVFAHHGEPPLVALFVYPFPPDRVNARPDVLRFQVDDAEFPALQRLANLLVELKDFLVRRLTEQDHVLHGVLEKGAFVYLLVVAPVFVAGQHDGFEFLKGTAAVVNLILFQIFIEPRRVRPDLRIADDPLISFGHGLLLDQGADSVVFAQDGAVRFLVHIGAPGQLHRRVIALHHRRVRPVRLADSPHQRALSAALQALDKEIHSSSPLSCMICPPCFRSAFNANGRGSFNSLP